MDSQNTNSAEEQIKTAKPVEVYSVTAKDMEDLTGSFPYYDMLKTVFKEGESKAELRKRYMLKAIDEVWVRAIEDTIPSLDVIMRNPGMLLQEQEAILPIEQTRKVTSRSIQHLSMHTDFINEIRDDGTVMPSKLLNVFQDETVLSYENKFINTLLSRLFGFVSRRYDLAEACGEDEKNSKLDIEQSFEIAEKEQTGKIHVTIELSEKPKEKEIVKNYIYTSDLWRRVQKIYSVVLKYMDSDFVRNVGKNYIHPPVMRTNKLLKNVDFHQCLTLWEFLDEYDNTGYETLIQEDLENIDEKCLKDMFNTISMQFVVFQQHIRNEFEEEQVLDEQKTDEAIKPKIKDELDPLNEREFDVEDLVPDEAPEPATETGEEDEIEEAILIALAADDYFVQEEAEDEEATVLDEGKIVYRYRYSFLSRLIMAQNPTQDFYTEIKNELLAYNNVKSRISWNHEAFSAGRKKCARINVKGKTVFLYLPLDPKDYADSKYHITDVSDVKKNKDMPLLLKVRSNRGVKYAKELIAIVMEMLGLTRLENPTFVDYHLPYATPEELAKRKPPLVKIIGGEAEDNDTGEQDEVEEVTKTEELDEVSEGAAVTAGGRTFTYKYRYSFLARLTEAGEPLQTYYEEVKNHILSYDNVKSGMAWGHESFRSGRKRVAKIKGRGKTLLIYLPLDPKDYYGTKYRFIDLTEKKSNADYPFLFKVKSDRSLRYAKELIDAVMNNYGLTKLENFVPENYHYEYATPEELAKRTPPLVKIIGENGAEEEKQDLMQENTLTEELPESFDDEVDAIEIEGMTLAEEEAPEIKLDAFAAGLGTATAFEYKYRYSFLARLTEAGEPLQTYYEEIKNYILSFDKTKSSMAWAHETFKNGRKPVAQIKGRGKKLQIYLPVEASVFENTKYHVENLAKDGKTPQYPTRFKVTSTRSLKYAKEIIDTVMAGYGIAKGELLTENYHLPYKTTEEMLNMEKPLVKYIGSKEK